MDAYQRATNRAATRNAAANAQAIRTMSDVMAVNALFPANHWLSIRTFNHAR
ncbi:MAG: hypothetical protein J2P21_17810 [Chloracidobacterium sp.]|nr:hypothetical protein [Chloracidobacterium sp.]